MCRSPLLSFPQVKRPTTDATSRAYTVFGVDVSLLLQAVPSLCVLRRRASVRQLAALPHYLAALTIQRRRVVDAWA